MRPYRRIAVAAAVVLAAGVLPAAAISAAGAADDTLFTPSPSFEPAGSKVRVQPEHFAAVRIDLAQVRAALRGAPRSGAGRGSLGFRVPTPSGSTERFAVQRTAVMESKLATAHPEISTYSGRSLDHPGTTIALDVTPMGFHASVRGPHGQLAWYVDPAFNTRGTTTHLSYYGGAVPRTVNGFAEKETREIRSAVTRRGAVRAPAPGALVRQRVYRLALTSDPSYAAYFGAENVLAEKVTLINRVNQIYNDDLAITLRLVNATDDLNFDTDAEATGANGPCGAHPCFDPPGADPDTQPGQLDFCDVPGLGRNRTVLGQLVGASNYDIGHLALGVNGGGIAYLGVVGRDYKGGGCTGLPEPKGDFFAIDYVAHELGHQFGGNHTFNGVQHNCSGGNRNGATSVEPGSGTSVMAYAGICRQDNLQPHSDPYFSQRSTDEVSTYTGSPTLPGAEVQTVSLRGFDTDGDTITLDYPGSTGPITLTRGTDYSASDLRDAIETLTSSDASVEDVIVTGWGYDPNSDFVQFPAPLTAPDDTGFEVIFAPTADPDAPGDYADEPSLTVTSSTSGVSGFVGETAKGGVGDNGGSMVIRTRNHAPRVNAPANRTLPIRTPFTLTGSGTDSDGDKLIYLWEQNDIGAADTSTTDGGTSLVDNSKSNGPLFRVFGVSAKVTDEGTLESPSPGENLANGSPSRTFPDLAQVLRGNTNALTGKCPPAPPLPADPADFRPVAPTIVNCFSEFLPTRGYVGTAGSSTPAMHFRLTARDGFPNGGGAAHDDVTLRIDRNAGPFRVTSQRSWMSLLGGTTRMVTWQVNGTRRLAANVRIRLSTDGGRTWTRVLANSTANDGSQLVRLPRIQTRRARIKIAAVDNYFFAVNRAGFRIR